MLRVLFLTLRNAKVLQSLTWLVRRTRSFFLLPWIAHLLSSQALHPAWRISSLVKRKIAWSRRKLTPHTSILPVCRLRTMASRNVYQTDSDGLFVMQQGKSRTRGFRILHAVPKQLLACWANDLRSCFMQVWPSSPVRSLHAHKKTLSSTSPEKIWQPTRLQACLEAEDLVFCRGDGLSSF